MNPWKRWQRFRIVISSIERKRASEKNLYHTLLRIRLAFHLDHLPLMSGTIIGDLKGGKPKGLHRNQPSSRSTVIGSTPAARLAGIKAASMPTRIIRTQATASAAGSSADTLNKRLFSARVNA